jgi:DNA-binding NtrC family response regulator
MTDLATSRALVSQRVLLVEDDRGLRQLLADEFRELGLGVLEAASGEDALSMIGQDSPSIVVSDLRLPGIDGIDLMQRIRRMQLRVCPAFVVITAFGTVDDAVDALKRGADDFLTKPLDLEHLRLRIRRLLEVQRLKREVATNQRREAAPSFHGLLGRSLAMQTLFDDIPRVAAGRGAVAIIGESGVGKELVARAVHRESDRRSGPFVPVNCAGIPESLLESEFFGHEPGSFTGATKSRPGLFAQANSGTILLDEITELPVPLQAKLLRVLQDGAVRRVGSDREVPLDVRVLVATNRDLEHEVEAGRFRKDLFFRLNTFTLEVPPLRERDGDVELLTRHFVERFRREADKVVTGVEPEVLEHLCRHPFPGNVRELENIVEHAVTFSRSEVLTLADLPARVRRDGAHTDTGDRPREIPAALLVDGELLTLDELTLRYVRHVHDLTGGNKRRAATLLGISRQTLYRHLERDNPE